MANPTAQSVVITGAARGIGAATARRFAAEGWQVGIFDVADGEPLAEELRSEGSQAWFRNVDVTDADSVRSAIDDAATRCGRLDALVNNAGIVRDAQLVKFRGNEVTGAMSEPDFDAVIGVNLKGAYLCTQAAVPHLKASGGGSITNATSVVALHGNFGQTNYAAAKGGLITMSKVWTRELGRHGIRVNCIAPGFIDTEMLKSIPEPLRTPLVEHTPLGRLGQPEEVANAYYWLASDQASFVTGVVLSVDGGVVLGT